MLVTGICKARGELVELLRAVRQHDAAPGIEHRLLGVEDHVQGPGHLPGIGMVGGVVALDLDGLGKLGHGAGLTHILGQVHQHRPRPPGPGDMKGLVYRLGQILDVLDQVVVLGAGPGDAHDVHLLKGVVADQGGGHLAGEHHDGDGVQVGRGNARHRVGGAGARGDQGHPHLGRGPGIAVRGVDRSLFVAYQDMPDAGGPVQFVIDIEDHPAGVTEDVLDSLPLQAFHQNLGAGHFHCRFSFWRCWARISSIRSRPASFNFWSRFRSMVSTVVR